MKTIWPNNLPAPRPWIDPPNRLLVIPPSHEDPPRSKDWSLNLDEYVAIVLDTFRRKRVIPVHPPCTLHLPPATLLAGTCPDSLLDTSTRPFPLPALGCARFRQARVHRPGLTFSADEKLIYSYAQFPEKLMREEWGPLHNAFTPPEDLPELPGTPVVCLARPGDQIFGHWLIDLLPRVWWLERHKPGVATYLLPTKTPDYAKEWLEHLGVPTDRWIFWEAEVPGYRVPDLWIPSSFRYMQICHPMLKAFATDLAATYGITIPERLTSDGPKYLISRKQWSGAAKRKHRTLLNLDEVEEAFIEHGFERLLPETLSIADQFKVMTECSALAGEDGSGMHLSLFAPETLPVISLRSWANDSIIQSTLCALKNQPISYAIGEPTDADRLGRSSNYSIDPALVDRILSGIA